MARKKSVSLSAGWKKLPWKQIALKRWILLSLTSAGKGMISLAGNPWILSNGVQDLIESGVPCCWWDQEFPLPAGQNDMCPWVSCIFALSCPLPPPLLLHPQSTLRQDTILPAYPSLWRPTLHCVLLVKGSMLVCLGAFRQIGVDRRVIIIIIIIIPAWITMESRFNHSDQV